MDTGATSHMTNSAGILSNYFPSKHLSHNNILVGNGNLIAVHGHGQFRIPNTHSPLHLRNVLHAPKLVKNLISVRKFTQENFVFVEFDPFGFSVKDLGMWSTILKCNSTGDLYPNHSTTGAIFSSNQLVLSALSTRVWHSHLGHPGNTILNSLYSSRLI